MSRGELVKTRIHVRAKLKVKSTVGSEVLIMGPGDVCRHPKGVLHGLEAIEESVVVEIKSPAPDIGAFFATRG